MKFFKRLIIFALIFCGFSAIHRAVSEHKELCSQLIRMHVVGNSNSDLDQTVKLKVKNAIVSYLEPHMNQFTTQSDAKIFIEEHLDKIKQIANQVLKKENISCPVTVSCQKEAFSRRIYDTFQLPSGIYQSLRVDLGEAKGKNWWCVAFPTLCKPVTQEAFVSTAVHSGMEKELADTLTQNHQYEVRFFFLDLIGKLQNLFYKG